MAKYVVSLLKWSRTGRDEDKVMDQRMGLGEGVLRCGSGYYEDEYSLEVEDYGDERRGVEEVYYVLNMSHPADYRRRSLSVGDLVLTPSGAMMLCCGCGWRDVTSEWMALHNEKL